MPPLRRAPRGLTHQELLHVDAEQRRGARRIRDLDEVTGQTFHLVVGQSLEFESGLEGEANRGVPKGVGLVALRAFGRHEPVLIVRALAVEAGLEENLTLHPRVEAELAGALMGRGHLERIDAVHHVLVGLDALCDVSVAIESGVATHDVRDRATPRRSPRRLVSLLDDGARGERIRRRQGKDQADRGRRNQKHRISPT